MRQLKAVFLLDSCSTYNICLNLLNWRRFSFRLCSETGRLINGMLRVSYHEFFAVHAAHH